MEQRALALVRDLRARPETRLMEEFLAEYGLSTTEGIALMCLAEALLRVPDAPTVDALIRDKIAPADWSRHLGSSSSPLVNASTWGLMLTGRVLDDDVTGTMRGLLRRADLTRRHSENELAVADLTMDEDAREVRRGGDLIELTVTEFELLRFLMRNPRRVLSKAQILDRVWNYDFGGQANVVELYISYLRKKIDAGREPMIHTMRGAGYVLKPAAGTAPRGRSPR